MTGYDPPLLPGIDQADGFPGMAEDLFAYQMIVDQYIRLLQAPQSFECNQPGIARSGADNVNFSDGIHFFPRLSADVIQDGLSASFQNPIGKDHSQS